MELTSETSMLKGQDRKLGSPLFNPLLQNVSCDISIPNPATSQANYLSEYQRSEIFDPALLSPERSKTDQRTVIKTIPNHNPLSLANLKKRKPDSPTSSSTKKIMISPLNVRESNQYLCTICGRYFNCHQALGGHKVHHNKKVRTIDVDAVDRYKKQHGTQSVEHECYICRKVFSTGQALGGHRRHCREAVRGQEAHRDGEIGEERNQNRGLNIDLNELPEEIVDTIGPM